MLSELLKSADNLFYSSDLFRDRIIGHPCMFQGLFLHCIHFTNKIGEHVVQKLLFLRSLLRNLVYFVYS